MAHNVSRLAARRAETLQRAITFENLTNLASFDDLLGGFSGAAAGRGGANCLLYAATKGAPVR